MVLDGVVVVVVVVVVVDDGLVVVVVVVVVVGGGVPGTRPQASATPAGSVITLPDRIEARAVWMSTRQ